MNLLDSPENFPAFFTKASGARVWDADGNEYIDLIAGKGSVLLGYADRRVDAAVCRAIRHGSMLPLTSDLYPRVARAVCMNIRSIERVKFFRAGSCAVSAAVRLARVHTGRSKILSCGYHGWHDWFIDRTSYPDDTGTVVDIHYDLDALAHSIERHRSSVAAVVVTPEPSLFGVEVVRRAFDLACEAGAVFILDEVKTGFRFTPRGYQHEAGVTPHLTTLAKAFANGYVLSAVGGRAAIMEAENQTHLSGTYETENVGLAAALATVEILACEDYSRLRAMYTQIVSELNRLLTARGIPARCVGSAFNAQLIFETETTATDFYRACARRGVTFYCFDDINLTFAHAPVFDEMLNRIDDAIRDLPLGAGGSLSPGAVCRYLARHKIISRRTAPDHPTVSAVHRAHVE